MSWEFTEDAAEFLDAAGVHLAARPVVNTVVSTAAQRAVSGSLKPTAGRPFWFAAARDPAGEVVGAAIRTAPFPPHAVFLLPMPDEAAALLGEALAARGEHPGGGHGATPANRIFCERYAALAGGTVRPGMRYRLHELGDLVVPERPVGRGRPATPDDADLVARWVADFGRAVDEAAGRPVRADHAAEVDAALVSTLIEEERAFVWEVGGRVVSLVCHNPPAHGVSRVGPVYTPAEERRHGYASACVADVCVRLRTEGHRLCLFADVDNPTTGHIYGGLGFRPVVEMSDLEIVP